MGIVVNFPEARRGEREGRVGARETATIMILPVVRIERPTDPPDEISRTNASGGRKRRRRARRS